MLDIPKETCLEDSLWWKRNQPLVFHWEFSKNFINSFSRCLWVTIRSSQRRCSIKKLFLKFCNFHRKTPVLESFFNKVADLEAPTQVFSCEYCEILRTSVLKNICKRLLLSFIAYQFLNVRLSTKEINLN